MSATAAVVIRQFNPFETGTGDMRVGDIGTGNMGTSLSADPSSQQHAALDGSTSPMLRSNRLRIVEADMMDMSVPPQVSTGGLAPWQVKKVKQHIEARIAHGIPLDELAQLVRLSTSYFSSAFKSTFGISPHSYIVCCRVDHAKYRMLASNAPLCEIALDCGLADQSHLSRVFRRVTGTTPSAWRRHASRADSSPSRAGRQQAAIALQ